MLKKTVTFTNIDGQTVTRDLYFNIAANELVEKEALSDQTYSQKLTNIASSNKLSKIYPMVLEFLEDGYGVRTPEGDFEKSPEAWAKFKNSLAFQALMDELLMDPSNNGDKLANFINGMLPPDLAARVREQQARPGFRPGADTTRPTPPVAGQPVDIGHVDATPQQPEQTPPPAQPVYQEPVVQEAPPTIQQTSEPRTPDLPGQPYQQ